jgi:hypothetical protein
MLDWRGDDAKRLVKENVAKAMAEFALTAEAESKKELRRGHGVVSGTLRRSIHAVLPGYDWGGDDVEPGAGSPERGGSEVVPDASNDQLTVELGSGLKYAMPVHQRREPHGGFTGYHYLTNGINKAKAKLNSILAKHKVQR